MRAHAEQPNVLNHDVLNNANVLRDDDMKHWCHLCRYRLSEDLTDPLLGD